MPGRNVFTVLEETTRKYGDAAALHQPLPGKGQAGYNSYTWQQWLTASREIAMGLRSLGLQNGDIACVLSETRLEFYLVDLGIMGAGGVSGALYTANPMRDLAENLRAAQSRFFFVEDEKTLRSLASAMHDLGGSLPPHVILMTGDESSPGVLTLPQLRKAGRQALAGDPGAFERLQATISPQDPAILYLTSGATGVPKMGVTSHAAILANIDMGPLVLPMRPDDSTLAFLPSAHIAQRIVLELVPMRMGTPVYFSESLARLPTDLRTVKPTVFLAPPRVWERMYSTVMTEVKKRPPLARRLFAMALELGMKKVRYQQAGRPVPSGLSSVVSLANKVVFAKVRERLGGRIRIAASGAAPLGKDLAEFFAAIGIPIVEGYGLTEVGILSSTRWTTRELEASVSFSRSRSEARRGWRTSCALPCVFYGYYQRRSRYSFGAGCEGWFSTGDIAEVDADGFWYITGRKKELIVSSNGKKIYPSRIENLFKMEPLVSQVLLVGDKKPYLTAILTLNTAQLSSIPGYTPAPESSELKPAEAEPVAKAVAAGCFASQ